MLPALGLALALSPVFAVAGCLKCDLEGVSVLYPQDDAFSAAASPFNLRFSYQPTAITFPKDASEVSQVVNAAISENLNVVARSGGHSYIANGLGGKNGALVVDLRNMTKIDINTSEGTAVIETGNRLGTIAVALNDKGRALPHGVCPDVGIGGHASSGGFGPTSRMWGMTLDRIKSVNVVLANGTIATASESENPDLFWAMRGAGPSYGIITSIEFNTVPTPAQSTVAFYRWNLTVSEASKAIHTLQSFVTTDIPSHLGVEVVVGPQSVEGRVDFGYILGWYAEDEGNFNRTVAPLLAPLPASTNVRFWKGPYLNSVLVNGQFEGSPTLTNTSLDPVAMYDKSLMTPGDEPASPEAVEAWVGYIAHEGFKISSSLRTQCTWELYGGSNSAVNSRDPDSTAFAHRDKMFTIACIVGNVKNSTYPDVGFTYLDALMDTLVSNMPSNWGYGAYVNYIDDRLPDWQLRYYGEHYARLQELKGKYDPNNVFSFPLAIQP